MNRSSPTHSAKPHNAWLLATLTLAIGAVLAGGGWSYLHQEQRARHEVEANLEAIAQLKVNQIAQWRAERLGDAGVLRDSPVFTEVVSRWLANPQAELGGKILARFRAMRRYNQYDDFMLVDARGQIRLSVTDRPHMLQEETIEALATAFRTRQPTITDLYAVPEEQPPHVAVVAPLLAGWDTAVGRPVAAVILQSETRQFLDSLIQNWPTPSRSAETILVRRDGNAVLFLNELRHQQGTALTLRIPLSRLDVPAVQAVLGHTGTFEGTDYRGVKVLSVLRRIPDSPWFLVTKIDEAEALADWQFRANLILSVIALLLLALTGAAWMIWQQRARYRELAQSAAALQKANRAFRVLSGFNQVLTRETDEVRLRDLLCRHLVEQGGYRLAWIGFAEQDAAKSVRPVAQAGYEAGYLEGLQVTWADTERGRGPTGTAIRTGQPVVAQDILHDPRMTVWREQAIQRGYAASVALPLTEDGRTFGVLMVYAPEPNAFDEEELKLLAELADDLAFGITALRLKTVRQRADSAEGLQKAGEELSACQSLEDVARVAARTPVAHLGARRAWVNTTAGRDRMVVAWSFPDIQTDAENCACARVVHGSGQRKLVPDVLGLPPCDSCRQAAAADGFRSCGTWPVLAGGQCVATLTIQTAETGADSHVVAAAALIEVFCRQVGYVWERLLTETKLRQLTQAIEQSPTSVMISDSKGTIEYVNPYFTRATGYTSEEARGQNPRILNSGQQPPEFYQVLWGTLTAGREWHGDFHNRAKNGELFWERASISPLRNAAGDITHFVAVKTDITERKQAEAALQQAHEDLRLANAELAQASKLKDEFLANMSHELRTPLNSILGLSEALLENPAGTLSPRQLKSLTTIFTSGTHLLALINDILDLSKIEAGQMQLNPETLTVPEFCESCLVFVRTQALQKKLALAFEPDARVAELTADPKRLKQILVNLLTNAVKFTPEGGRIGLTVGAPQDDDVVHFTVWDTGIGIAPEDQGKLFKAFSQIDSGLTRAQEGTGLGLALVAKLVELHGGSVALESAPGQGSRFTVTLPRVAAPARTREPAPPDTTDRRDYRQALVIEDDPSAAETPVRYVTEQPASHPPAASPCILLAEDNEANIETIGGYLEDKGYALQYAANGLVAVQLSRALRPALILMDIQMPVMDGLAAIKEIRADAALRAIPIVALTALAMPGDRERCLAAGATDYLSKPVGLKALAALIARLLPPSRDA